jgi:Saxitoxin biosynthesis operon protein SxtJ
MSIIKTIRKELSEIETTTKKIVQFGYVIAGGFMALGAAWLFRNHFVGGMVLVGIGLLSLLLTLVVPRSLLQAYLIWMGFATIVGYFVFRLFLILVYWIGFVPAGFVMRLFGADPLRLKRVGQASYWLPATRKSNPEMQF